MLKYSKKISIEKFKLILKLLNFDKINFLNYFEYSKLLENPKFYF